MSRTCKFGGTSLADANQIRKAVSIIKARQDRRHIVVSAPGKRDAKDRKVTDLFIDWHQAAGDERGGARKRIEARYLEIIRNLGISLDLERDFETIAARLVELRGDQALHYAKSRGEYLMGRVMANVLRCGFVDPADCVLIDKNGLPEPMFTYDMTAQAVGRAGGRCVMAGFYGRSLDQERSIKTFSRGGSDISGAILARATGAELYENWSDVDGMFAADPRVIEHPKLIARLTYREARELSYMGFGVIHPEALFPVQQKGTSTRILNTNNPSAPGTHILPDASKEEHGEVVGIASRGGFTVIDIEKALMNSDVGFGHRALEVLKEAGVSFEHCPTGIDEMSIVIDRAQLNDVCLARIKERLWDVCVPDNLFIDADIALVAVVGNGMAQKLGTAARLFGALGRAGVNVRLITQGAGERNIVVGVEGSDHVAAVKALYVEFFG